MYFWGSNFKNSFCLEYTLYEFLSGGWFLVFVFFIINQYCMPKLYGQCKVYLSLFSIVGLMLYYKQWVFKVIRRLVFNLFSYFCNTKMCVQYIASLMLCYKKCVFKASGKLLFSLFSDFCSIKNVFSKQGRGCFLVY